LSIEFLGAGKVQVRLLTALFRAVNASAFALFVRSSTQAETATTNAVKSTKSAWRRWKKELATA
jgi:hypothetical protein